MGSNPINLTFRFFLELTALFSFGYWGLNSTSGWIRYLLVILLPVIAAVIWGLFAVPGDPSRSGKAPVPVPGFLRLLLELIIFGFACWALYDSGLPNFSLIMGGLVILHYAVSYDRILWLIKPKS
jgi:hypothetical protein